MTASSRRLIRLASSRTGARKSYGQRRQYLSRRRGPPLAGWQTARVCAFIEENLHSNIGARDLSAVARRSRARFSRSFKRAFGKPPHAYVIKRRLERACRLMVTTPESLSQIALGVGFSDQSHLCKLFRRAFGQSPSTWRRYHGIPASISRAGIGEECQSRTNTQIPRRPIKSIAVELG